MNDLTHPRHDVRGIDDPGLFRRGLVAATALAISLAYHAVILALTLGHSWHDRGSPRRPAADGSGGVARSA